MLHTFFGNDTSTVRQKAADFLEQKKEAGITVERIDTDSYAPGVFINLSGATSLFGTETLYLIDTPSNQKDFFTDVIEHLEILAESPNTFVVIEESILAPEKKRFQKHAETFVEYKKNVTERFNAFSMADSLAKKNKRMLWVQLQEAYSAGLSPEEIIGTLWWQLKSLRLAALTQNAAEAGMKDFPYSKAKQSLKNFKPGEVESLSERLLGLYHEGHGGRVDITLALEKWTLTI